MKKIHFLMLMALATQSSFTAQAVKIGRMIDQRGAVIDKDGDVFFDAREQKIEFPDQENKANYDKNNDLIEKELRRRHHAASAWNNSDSISGKTTANIGDTNSWGKNLQNDLENYNEDVNKVSELIGNTNSWHSNSKNDLDTYHEIQDIDLPAIKFENQEEQSRLQWLLSNKNARLAMLAVALVGGLYLLNQLGVPQAAQEQLQQYVNTFSPEQKEALKQWWVTNKDKLVKQIADIPQLLGTHSGELMKWIGDTAEPWKQYALDNANFALEGAKGFGSTAIEGAKNVLGALDQGLHYRLPAFDGAPTMVRDGIKNYAAGSGKDHAIGVAAGYAARVLHNEMNNPPSKNTDGVKNKIEEQKGKIAEQSLDSDFESTDDEEINKHQETKTAEQPKSWRNLFGWLKR